MSTQDPDDALAAELAAALREADDVPEWFVHEGRELFAWYDVDAELAALTEHAAEAMGARSEGRLMTALTFTADALTIELELSGRVLAGQLVPPGPPDLEVRDPDGVRRVAVDELGFFRLDPAPSGPFRLRVTTASGAVVVTPVTRL